MMINNIWLWIDVVVYLFLFFIIFVVLNGFIIWLVCKLKDRRKKFMFFFWRSIKFYFVFRFFKENWKIMMMFFLVFCIFFVIVLLMNVVIILNIFWNNLIDKFMKEFFVLYFFYSIVKMLMYMNYFINFVLYCVFGINFCKVFYRIVIFKCRRNNDNYYIKRLFSYMMIFYEVVRI